MLAKRWPIGWSEFFEANQLKGEVRRNVSMVPKFLDLNNLSWQRQPFALSNGGRKVMGYGFVPECNHAQRSHACQFVPFFSATFAVPRIVEIQKFCYHGNVALPLLLSVMLILAFQSLWAQLFEGRLALNPGLNLTQVSFSRVQKLFFG